MRSNQEVNYLELTASHGMPVSQQALLMPFDCLLLSLSLTLSRLAAAEAMHSVSRDMCYGLRDAASYMDIMYSDTHIVYSMFAHTSLTQLSYMYDLVS